MPYRFEFALIMRHRLLQCALTMAQPSLCSIVFAPKLSRLSTCASLDQGRRSRVQMVPPSWAWISGHVRRHRHSLRGQLAGVSLNAALSHTTDANN